MNSQNIYDETFAELTTIIYTAHFASTPDEFDQLLTESRDSEIGHTSDVSRRAALRILELFDEA